MPKQKALLEQAKEEYQRVLLVNQAEEERLMDKRDQFNQTLKWADMFDAAPRETKHMILASLIDRVEVGSRYRIEIKFKLTARQFLDPDIIRELLAA